MTPELVLTPAHWVYLAGVLVIIGTMVARANVVAPAIVATFATVLAMTGDIPRAIEALFLGPLTAARELFNIFLVISLMTAFMNALKVLQSDVRIVRPFRGVMVNGHAGFLILGLVSYVLSLFFWPTPSVPLIAGILLPAAIYSGVPPIGAAMCIAIAGLGTALSSDYVIKVAPGISAKGAGVPMMDIADKALVLSLITGGVAFAIAYLKVRRSFVAPSLDNITRWEATTGETELAIVDRPKPSWHLFGRWLGPKPSGPALAMAGVGVPDATYRTMTDAVSATGGSAGSIAPADMVRPARERQPPSPMPAPTVLPDLSRNQVFWSKMFGILTPAAFLGVVVYMVLPHLIEGMKGVGGAAAAALVGGVAAVLATAAYDYRSVCRGVAAHVTEGFVFSFRSMSSVLPIAGFFFIGVASTVGPIVGLPEGSHPSGLLADLVRAGEAYTPHNPLFAAFSILLSGMITGIDGSGFAGLPLTGALAGALGRSVHFDVSTLAAIGQMGSVWTGKTLCAWSALAAVAGFARVPVLKAVRHLLLPVVCGLVASTLFAVIYW